MIEKVIYYTAALSLPNIFLFFLYDNNRVMNDIRFNQVSVLAAILAVISVCLYMLLCRIIRSRESALLVLMIFWIPFWLFEPLFSIAIVYSPVLTRVMLLVFLMGGIAGIAVYFRLGNLKIFKSKQVFLVLTVVLSGLFAFNFIPGLYRHINITYQAREADTYKFKTDFMVDPSLPSPDIYWLHMDGMLSFNAVEKYFGDSQETLKEELIKRGFVLNEDAVLLAGGTYVAYGALLSPDFYDNYFKALLYETNHLEQRERMRLINNQMMINGMNIFTDLPQNLEIIHAFIAADYTVRAFAELAIPLPFLPDNDIDSSRFFTEDLIHLLVSTTPLSIIKALHAEEGFAFGKQHVEEELTFEQQYVNRLVEIRDNHRDLFIQWGETIQEGPWIWYGWGLEMIGAIFAQSPKLVYASNLVAHSPFNKLSPPGTPNEVDKLYMLQHERAALLMLTAIDMIIEQNPDAVIILQADHDYLRGVGYTDAQIVELMYAVMSAVRIPPQYGGLTEPLDPRDISRLLVNRFVGENYNMLRYSQR